MREGGGAGRWGKGKGKLVKGLHVEESVHHGMLEISSGVSRSDGWLLNEHVLCPRRSTRVAEHRVEVPLTAPRA